MSQPEARVIVEEVDEPTPRGRSSRWINLDTVDSQRLEMGRVYREMREGKLDPALGTKLVWVLATLAKVTETSVLERRLMELEALYKTRGITHEGS